MLYQTSGRMDSKIGADEIMVVCDRCTRTIGLVSLVERVIEYSGEKENLCLQCKFLEKMGKLARNSHL